MRKSFVGLCWGVGVALSVACGNSTDPGESGGSANGGGSASGGASGNGGGSASGGNGGNIIIGGSGGGAADGGVTDPDSGCATSTAAADFIPPALMFVVDTSGSMNDPAPGSRDSKWTATKAALGQALNGLPDTTLAGLFLYPGRAPGLGGNQCIDRNVEVVVGVLDAARRGAMTNAMRANAVGGTPTADAFKVGADTISSTQAPGGKYVLLVTDGDPTYALNCVGDGRSTINRQQQDALVQQVRTARGSGIKTFVVGSPGSENSRNLLSRMASEGGTAAAGCTDAGPNFCHFDMTTAPDFGAALNAALGAISGQALSCEFNVPAPPDGETLDLGKVNVVLTPSTGTPEEFRKSGDGCATGQWQYSPDNSKILLCPSACDRVKADGTAKVDVIFGCATQIE